MVTTLVMMVERLNLVYGAAFSTTVTILLYLYMCMYLLTLIWISAELVYEIYLLFLGT